MDDRKKRIKYLAPKSHKIVLGQFCMKAVFEGYFRILPDMLYSLIDRFILQLVLNLKGND